MMPADNKTAFTFLEDIAMKKSITKLALVAAFAAALAGCGQSGTPEDRNVSTRSDERTLVNTEMQVVNQYGTYLDRYVDFKTEQLCIGKTGSGSGLVCRDFEDLTPAQKAYVEEMRQEMARVTAKGGDGSSRVLVNTTSRVVNEYGTYFDRYVDFKTEMLLVAKTGSSSDLSGKDFSQLNPAQKAYVEQMRAKLDRASAKP